MREHISNTKSFKNILRRGVTALLLVAMLIQPLGTVVGAVGFGSDPLEELIDSVGSSSNGVLDNLDVDAITEAMKGDIIKSIKKDLLQRIEDHSLSGDVGIILTFSGRSLVDEYSENYADKMSYEEFKNSDVALEMQRELEAEREAVLNELLDKGLVYEIKHTYSHLLDGAFVATTYEALEEISEVNGIAGMMVSNSYKPMEAVSNPVDVYDTGIFNSGSVDYTGKGTIVAVLDTGCDYAHPAFTTHTVSEPKYSRDDIESLLYLTTASSLSQGLEAREVYYGNLTGGKIAFGYDYADKDADIMPFENSHGTHVAGIIAGKDETITGVAIDAQLAIMKVFSDYDDGAKDGDILAALEDCIVLGVDAINMSLGTSCGFSSESAYDELYKNVIYGNIEKAGISLIVAASNDHSSGYGGENGNTNKTGNPDSATVGAPSSYAASFTVASVSGKKENYMLANGKDIVFFIKSYSTAAKEYDFFDMMGIKPGDKKTYEYVTVPGFGLAINYAGIDVKGKVALVSRGDITFEEKVQYAQEAGAIAVIIYNNVYGDITMTIGNHAKIPAVSIGRDEGEMLAAHATGTFEFDLSNSAGPFMSDFSSWGPTPDLKLKPEITAHGGNITSSVVGGEYDEMSGTSMAAPNMCGIALLIRQYVNEKFPDLSAAEARDLVNRLCMSTATIAYDKKGMPYSPRKQGAGLADIRKATTTAAYLMVDGIGKTKLELGDDPLRKGVYEMEIKVVNISASAQSYRLGNITMTESVSAAEPEYVAEIAYILSNSSEYSAVGGTITDGVLTVEAGQTATVNVKFTLSNADKSYLDSTFENGMYVEGFLTFDNIDENGVDMNAPFLAFYGNWGDAPIFDLDYYEVETEAHDDAIDDDDKIKADYYATTPLGTYYYDYIIPLGTYLYEMDEEKYAAIPATREHAAVSLYKTSISGIYGVFTGLLRGAKELNIKIINTETGEVAWEMTEYNCAKAHYYGAPRGYMAKFDLAMMDDEANKLFANNNAHFEVVMSAKLDWNGGENTADTYSFSFYVDYEAPTLVDSNFRTEYDKSRKENRYYLDLTIYDNHYAMSCRPVLIYDFREGVDDVTTTFSSLTEYPIPIYQKNKGENTKVSIEITDYMDIIKNSETPNGITLYVDDYAMNANVFYVPFPETDSEDIDFKDYELTLDINETFDLTKFMVDGNGNDITATDFLHTLKWSSTDESVVAVKDGMIEALSAGEARIKVTADTWLDYTYTGKDSDGRPQYDTEPHYKQIRIKVTDSQKTDDPNSGINTQIEDLFFTSYDTLFAHNTQIKFSEIGRTGSTNYFDGNYSLACYPAEQIKLNYELKPWNLSPDRYELKWKTNKPDVATVDENGVVTAMKEGKARISLEIYIDGSSKPSLIVARLSLEVKSEFIIENRELLAYKGWGGDVVIPDDEGILYIGSYAFAHYNLDNKKVVEKDENGYYDLDDKKTPIGNKTVKSVVIPEGVEAVNKYAFYNCTALESITLPESCKNIMTGAFQYCTKLKNINFDNVKVVSDSAFDGCSKLDCNGNAALQGLYSVGKYAFRNTAFTSLELNGLSRISPSAFYGCRSLQSVVLGERTRISDSMFEKCTALKNITIYSDTIGNKAFYGCTALTSAVIAGNVTYLGNEAFSGCTKLSSVAVNGQLELIGNKAFYGCSALNTFTLPDGKIAIGDSVFASSGLKTLVLKANTELESLGSGAFPNTSLTVDISASDVYDTVNGAIYNKSGDTLIFVLPSAATTFTVPKSVKHIGAGAFIGYKNLVTVSFESGSALESIGDSAFAGCTALTTVNLPSNSITVGAYAFNGCTALTTIDLSGVTSVGTRAFNSTKITEAKLTSEGVKVAPYAFSSLTTLKTLTLGKNAELSEYAFTGAAITTVTLNGDAKIGAHAFEKCTSLTTFDFLDVTGEIGDYAFYNCSKLYAVNAPKITVIGEGCFAGCTSLQSLVATEVKTIKAGAFFDVKYANDLTKLPSTGATLITTIELPKLESIGDYAFFASIRMTYAQLPSLTKLGKNCFAMCQSLRVINMSEELTEIPDQAFFACSSLRDFDFSNIEKIGAHAFYYVNLPKDLVLENVVYLDNRAFAEVDLNVLESVTAPKLTYIGNDAFSGCKKLEEVNAPMVEYIGDSAFAQTAITVFELNSNIKHIGINPFVGANRFEAFYVVEDGVKLYDKVLDSLMIQNGVLYTENSRGYTLNCYPLAKTEEEFIVADGTTRIDIYAAMNNTVITRVVFPSTLRSIADFAFFGCSNLDTVIFNSYYAPTLESAMSVALNELQFITVENVDQYPGFMDLYEYSYSFKIDGWTGRNLYQNNFKGGVGGVNAPKMTAIIPDNCVGYTSLIYNAYFNVDTDSTSGVTAGKYAISFIEAVHNLPENIDRFDRILMDAAITAYNALDAHQDEKFFVDAEVIAKFNKLRSEYNVNVVDGMISHLFGMYDSEYCFEQLKEVTLAYQALTDAEREMVADPTVLELKKNELATAMNVDLDFSLKYSEQVKKGEDPGTSGGNDDTTATEDGNGVIIVLIITASVVGVGLGVCAGVMISKSRAEKKARMNSESERKADKDEEASDAKDE